MRFLLVLIALVFTSLGCYGQHERDYWYFGSYAGLHFDDNGPQTNLDGVLQTTEGCATISTRATGDLLFYTDGTTVWNKEHEEMLNGNGLHGNLSSTQSAIIVPNPNKRNLYYVFTVDDNGGSEGLQYSEVDMDLDNGLGGVTSTKNVMLQAPVAEKLTGVRNATSSGYWVVAHSLHDNDFFAYAVTSSGVNTTAVVSSVTNPEQETGLNFAGAMKLSPDGEKLGVCYSSQDQLYDFDNATGEVSNLRILHQGSSTAESQLAYGVEFSKNSNAVYFSYHGAPVVQYNLEAGDVEAIKNSRLPLSPGLYGGLQLGPDGKIYVATAQPHLDRINAPNTIGPGCDYEENAVDLQGRSSNRGLPNFIKSFLETTIFFENTCLGQETQFSLASEVEGLEAINWDFDDPASGTDNTSTSLNPTHVFSALGTYQVSVEITVNGLTYNYEVSVTIYEQPETGSAPDILVCDDDADGFYSFDLTTQTDAILNGQDPGVFTVDYYSSQENFDDNIPIAEPGDFQNDDPYAAQTIFAKVKNSGNADCEASTSFDIEVFENPILNPAPPILMACADPDLSTQTDLFAEFDLTAEEEDLLDDQIPGNFSFQYYTDAALSDEINSPGNYQNLDSPQTIYVSIENNENADCFAETSFELKVVESPEAAPPITLQACGLGDGTAEFDTSGLDNEILDGQTGFTVSYLNSEGETLASPLPDPFVSEARTLIARVENTENPDCFAETEVHLIVKESPKLSLPNKAFLCGSGDSIQLTADAGADAYLWSTGETSQSITVDETGEYTVTATYDYENLTCENSKTVHVAMSSKAVVAQVKVKDWSVQRNSITIEANGDGDYVYSLDDVHYQESNRFENLNYNTNYTVYVKDKNGCGLVTKTVYLLYYPKFFTPNNDGKNDTWQIFNAHTEPGMEIYIFDRFGKLLEKIDPMGRGWSGNFHGKPMPSNDYWFLVKRKNGKRYTGHFTLKR